MLNVAKKFANSSLRLTSRNISKPSDLVGGLVNSATRNFSNDNNYGHDPRFLIIVDDEMKAQKEALKSNPELLSALKKDPSGYNVDVTGLQKNILKRLQRENPVWAKPYIDQITKEMEEMQKQNLPSNEGKGRGGR